MIERKIHYIWFGNKKPKKVIECIKTWKKELPEYKIIEWNEKNIDIERLKKENKFFKKCFDKKLWAYVSDYLRIKILYEEGGIYLDTDMEILKNIDPLLINDLFLGYESKKTISFGICGCTKYHKIMKKMLRFYNDEIWNSNLYIITDIVTEILKREYGKDLDFKDEKIKVYPKDYFYPYGIGEKFDKKCLTENSYTIHWWENSWGKDTRFLFLKYKHLPFIIREIAYARKITSYYIRRLLRSKKF